MNLHLDYRGTVSTTYRGNKCQKWSVVRPNYHTRGPGTKYDWELDVNDSFNNGDHNYCRNPDNDLTSWCYTLTAGIRDELCVIGNPGEDYLFFDPKAKDYSASISVTRDGRSCVPWSAVKNIANFSNFDYDKAGAFCRNPGPLETAGCYFEAADGSFQLGLCDVGEPASLDFCVEPSQDENQRVFDFFANAELAADVNWADHAFCKKYGRNPATSLPGRNGPIPNVCFYSRTAWSVICENGKVVGIYMSVVLATGPMDFRLLAGLPNLKFLNFLIVSNSGVDVGVLSSSTSLECLSLVQTDITGASIPSQFPQNLRELNLENNFLTGTIPSTILDLKSLQLLDLRANSIGGTIPKGLAQLVKLNSLDLAFNKFTGTVPQEFNNSKLYSVLDFSDNQLDSGHTVYTQYTVVGGKIDESSPEFAIVKKIGDQLGKIQFQLGSDGLVSIISKGRELNLPYFPSEIGLLKGLTVINFFAAGMTGTIPTEILLLPKLNHLILGVNSFSEIPPGIFTPALNSLEISQNAISYLPTEVGLASNLQYLVISYNLVASVPTELCRLRKIINLNFKGNLISSIPECISDTNCHYYQFSSNLLQSLPGFVLNWTKPMVIDFSWNNITGTLPASLLIGPDDYQLTSITIYEPYLSVNLANNRLSGTLPNLRVMNTLGGEYLYLVDVNLCNNQFTGTIPSIYLSSNHLALCKNNFTAVDWPEYRDYYLFFGGTFDLSHNQITGTIPSSYFFFNAFNNLMLNNNRFTGEIHPNLLMTAYDMEPALRTFDLSNNQLNGTMDFMRSTVAFSTGAGNTWWTENTFNFQNNRLHGPLVLSKKLFGFLDVSYNNLSGTLDLSESGAMGLVLDGNRLLGSIPSSFPVVLHELNVAFCSFTGTFPATAGVTLYTLNLDGNNITGTLPQDLFFKSSLEEFSIANNFLDGPIPKNILNSDLYVLSLSNNKFSSLNDNFRTINDSRGPISVRLEFNQIPDSMNDTVANFEKENSNNRFSLSMGNNPIPCVGLPRSCWEREGCKSCGKHFVGDCGDGMKTGTETCDDGNTVSGDGCSSGCLVESGWGVVTGSDTIIFDSRNRTIPNPSKMEKTSSSDNNDVVIGVTVSLVLLFLIVALLIVSWLVIRSKQSSNYFAFCERRLNLANPMYLISEFQVKLSPSVPTSRNIYRCEYKGSPCQADEIRYTMGDSNLPGVESFEHQARAAASIPPHKNIIKFFGVCLCETKQTLAMIHEKPTVGPISSIFNHPKFKIEVLSSLLEQSLLALAHIAKYKMIHNNINTSTILVTECSKRIGNSIKTIFEARVSGFGVPLSHSDSPNTFRYFPLERVNYLLSPSSRSPASLMGDVWSFGVVTWELWERMSLFQAKGSPVDVIPFVECKNAQELAKFLEGGGIPVIQSPTPAVWKQIMTSCLVSLQNRPSFNTLIQSIESSSPNVTLSRVKLDFDVANLPPQPRLESEYGISFTKLTGFIDKVLMTDSISMLENNQNNMIYESTTDGTTGQNLNLTHNTTYESVHRPQLNSTYEDAKHVSHNSTYEDVRQGSHLNSTYEDVGSQNTLKKSVNYEPV